ncbi:MAG: hypothetical protein KAR08_09445, partial [Candidatus Heimdallarchaeota archaeon]|nr:hypothetical protein [Candidatus Heimdallarchaeota archaeon]
AFGSVSNKNQLIEIKAGVTSFQITSHHNFHSFCCIFNLDSIVSYLLFTSSVKAIFSSKALLEVSIVLVIKSPAHETDKNALANLTSVQIKSQRILAASSQESFNQITNSLNA